MARDVDQAQERRRVALALERAGRYDEAAAAYREALRADPEHAPTHVRLGVVLRSAGRDAEATRAFQAALRIPSAPTPPPPDEPGALC